jgi:alpha-D-ribose 1-methylphosphonate 5-triphosphate diphosphatase
MRTVTAAPSQAVGLADRGTLAIGQRADIIRFAINDQTPVLQETWSAGKRVS